MASSVIVVSFFTAGLYAVRILNNIAEHESHAVAHASDFHPGSPATMMTGVPAVASSSASIRVGGAPQINIYGQGGRRTIAPQMSRTMMPDEDSEYLSSLPDDWKSASDAGDKEDQLIQVAESRDDEGSAPPKLAVESEGGKNQANIGVFDDAFLAKKEVHQFLEHLRVWRLLDTLKQHTSEPKPDQAPSARKTLVLDMDETLIGTLPNQHYSDKGSVAAAFGRRLGAELLLEDHKGLGAADWDAFVFKRPGLDEFLREVSLLYNLVIYTAATPAHADPILDALEMQTDSILFSRRLYRHDFKDGTKDLTVLGEPLQDVVMIDDTAQYNLPSKNMIPIKAWLDHGNYGDKPVWEKNEYEGLPVWPEAGDPPDQELLDLLPILRKLAVVDDVQVMWPQALRRDDSDGLA